MITDAKALDVVQKSWNGVQLLQGKVQRGILGSFATGGFSAFLLADIAHNLPLMQAFGVLNDVLLQLRKEKRFEGYDGRLLGHLMQASRTALPWVDYDRVMAGVKVRNDVAHHGEIATRAICRKYIDAIEAELAAWGIIPAEPLESNLSFDKRQVLGRGLSNIT